MFDFLSMKPKQTPVNTAKYLYRDCLKEVIQSLFKNAYYDPNNLEITKKTNVEIFDILEQNLEEEISWKKIGFLFNKARGGAAHINLFDNRAYYVITSGWYVDEKNVNAVKECVKAAGLGPVFWRFDDDTLTFELPVSYPFNEEVLINSLKLFDEMEASILHKISQAI